MTNGVPARTPRTPGLLTVYPPLPKDVDYPERSRRLAALQERMRVCQLCVTAGYLPRADSVAGVRGRVGDAVMVVGQAPGHLSVERRMPFMGPAGRLLDRWLQQAGYAPGALHREVYISAMTRCDPGKAPRGSGDRKPSPAELALCRPYLEGELEVIRPSVILPVGGMAISAFLGPAKLDDVVGRAFTRNGVLIVPLPHPSGVSRWLNNPAHQRLVDQALDQLRRWREGVLIPPAPFPVRG